MFSAVMEHAVLALPSAADASTPDVFRLLLSNPDAEFVFLLEARPFDATLAQDATGLPPPAMAQALLAGPTFDVTGDESPVWLSDVGFTTEPADDPANIRFAPRLSAPYELRASLFDGAEPGGRAFAAAGSIEALNGDAGLDGWASLSFAGRPVAIKVGGRDFDYADFATVHDGIVEGLAWTEDTVSIALRDKSLAFERSVHPATYAGTGGLEGGSDVQGAPKPGLFGICRNVTPVLVESATQIYQIHDGPIEQIVEIRDKGVALISDGDVSDLTAASPATGHYVTDLAHGAFRLGSQPDGRVTLDAKGDNAGGYVDDVAGIVRRIATARLGVDSLDDPAEIDTGTFAALAAAQPASVGIYETGGRSAAAVLDELTASIGGWWGFTRAGLLFVGRLAAPAAPEATIDASDIVAGAFEAMAAIPPAWRSRVGWRRNWTVQTDIDLAGGVSDSDRAFYARERRFATASDTAIRARDRAARDVEIAGLFDLEADALAEAERRQALHGVARTRYRAQVESALFRYWLGAPLTLQHDRFGLDAGQDFAVVAIEEDGATYGTVLELWG